MFMKLRKSKSTHLGPRPEEDEKRIFENVEEVRAVEDDQ